MLTPRSSVVAFALLGALAATACVSSTPPPADTDPIVLPVVTTQPEEPPEPVDEETIALVTDYWEGRERSWVAGPEAGLAYVVDHNHPLLPYTVDDCRNAWFDGTVPPGFVEHNALQESSITSDPGWTMAVGPLAGRDLGEGLLKMVVAFSYEGSQLRVADRVATVHLQVEDDEVSSFLLCDETEIIVSMTTEAPATGTDGGTATGTDGGTTTTTPTAEPVTILPPITATPAPVDSPGGSGGDGDGDGDGSEGPSSPPPPPGERPPGTGIDFCEANDPGAQPVAGDYFICPDDDYDPYATETATATEDTGD